MAAAATTTGGVNDIRRALAGRGLRTRPAWIPAPRFDRYGDWQQARGVKAARQADYGFMWRHNRHEIGRRLSWVPETGELILVGPRQDGPEADWPIEILADGLFTDEQVRKAMPRWAYAHNTFRDSLGWLRRTLAKTGYGFAAAP